MCILLMMKTQHSNDHQPTKKKNTFITVIFPTLTVYPLDVNKKGISLLYSAVFKDSAGHWGNETKRQGLFLGCCGLKRTLFRMVTGQGSKLNLGEEGGDVK